MNKMAAMLPMTPTAANAMRHPKKSDRLLQILQTVHGVDTRVVTHLLKIYAVLGWL